MYNWTIFVALTLITAGQCAKILGVFHWPAPSHHMMGERLMKELAARGHEVTFISPFPLKEQVKNLRQIELTGFLEYMQGMKNETNMLQMAEMSKIKMLMFFFLKGLFSEMTDKTLGHADVQKLIHSNETFDLIIKEQFHDDALQGFAYRFNAPLLVLSTLGPSIHTNRLVGNPTPPSYVVDLFLDYSPKMSFLQRTRNTIAIIFSELMYLHSTYTHNAILHKYFPSAPHVSDLIYNTSFVLLNSHISYDNPVPRVPNMAHIGGYHIEPTTKMPEDLQKFLDDSKEGVIYFSLGSLLQSKDLPKAKCDALLKVFSRLKMKVLWKWEDEKLIGQPDNVRIEKWVPQQSVLGELNSSNIKDVPYTPIPLCLAHPNVKLFITHGGLLSTIEAIYHGIPVIGIPVFGDQTTNMANAQRNGYGYSLPYMELSEDSLTQALNEMLQNPKYRENAKMRSQLMHDQPLKPMDNAVYWVEYVIRHKGAPHLRTAALNLSWYQYLLLDVVLFITLVLITATALIYIGFKKLLCRKRKPKRKTF